MFYLQIFIGHMSPVKKLLVVTDKHVLSLADEMLLWELCHYPHQDFPSVPNPKIVLPIPVSPLPSPSNHICTSSNLKELSCDGSYGAIEDDIKAVTNKIPKPKEIFVASLGSEVLHLEHVVGYTGANHQHQQQQQQQSDSTIQWCPTKGN